MFTDKKKEIEQIINYVNKIVISSDIKWKVSANTFSVTISDGIDRIFTKAELESYEQQIKYFIKLQKSLEDEEKTSKLFQDNKDSFEKYLKMLKNIRNKHEMCKRDFFSVHDPVFEGDQYLINQKGIVLYPEVHNDNNDLLDRYNFMPKDYHSFGKCILNVADQHIINNEFYVIFNRIGYNTIRFDFVDEFINEILFKDTSINPIKIGKRFVEFLITKKDSISADTRKYDLQSIIKNNESLKMLLEFISGFTDERTLLFAQVPKPAHTLHLIQPAYALWCLKKDARENYCPIENILFCEEDHNFQDSLNRLSNSNDNNLYFIVHPENLRSDEMHYLKTFISTRRSQNLKPKDNQNKDKPSSKNKDKPSSKNKDESTNVPRILIITALPTSFFNLEVNDTIGFKDSTKFEDENISEFATFNAQWRRTVCKIHNDIFLFSSKNPGQGKTYHINNIIENSKNKFAPEHDTDEESKENYKISVSHVYFDITTDEIPESIIDQTIVHFSISPEIFLNNFQIIDQLYILVQYGFFIFKSGAHLSYYKGADIITTFLIEIPNLEPENSLKNYYDFPIAPSDNLIEWDKDKDKFSANNNIYDIIKEEFKGVGDEKSFQKGHFKIDGNEYKISVDDNVKQLANLLFKNIEINSYTDLITESKSLFFGGEKKKDNYDNRIISKFKKMIDNYSQQIIDKYRDNDKMKRILFLLAIRTALYIWHFTPLDFHSIILLIPKRLMTRKPFDKDNGWIFACFYSKRDKGQTWEEDKINDIDFRDDKTLIKKAKEELSKEHEYIHILTDSEKKDDIYLQTQFLETILLLLPAINFENNSLNPFNIASILLMLFSDLDHYPQDSFPKIIDDLSNKDISIEDCQRKFEESEYNEKIEWTKMDELLAYYLRNTKSQRKPSNTYKLISQLKSELSKYEGICNIINISFSKTYFGRFIEIILKIYYGHFSILQGDTGCGKTSVVRLLNDIISLAKSDYSTKTEINWHFLMIDFHGSYNQDDFDNEIKRIRKDLNMDAKETEKNSQNEKVIVFLDEVNTSPAYYYVIDHIQNSISEYFSYIAAINAYEEVNPTTRDLSRVGIQQKINRQLSNIKLFTQLENIKDLSEDYDANKYAYNVKKPHESVKSAVILTDPQQFDEENPLYITKEENKEKEEPKLIVCFSDEERNAIRSIITKILLQWENVTKIQSVLSETINLLSQLISEIFLTVRSFMKLRAIFSYRDVLRCTTIFTNIFDYFHEKDLESELPDKSKDSTDNFWKKITSISIVIAVYVSLISRFSHEKIKVNESILKRLEGHQFIKVTGSNPTTICVYEIVLNYISNEYKWPSEILPSIKCWDQITILFAYAKCAKYIQKEKAIYPLPSLMLHLLILSLTVSASFHDINTNDNDKKSFSNSDFFTCLIIGMPGTSKSKAVEIYKKYYLKKDSEKNDYFITTYLCSRTSDSDSLLAQFMNGAYFLNSNNPNDQNIKSKKAIVILEEVGLANYNPSRPLKILHHLCDKGVQIKKNNKLEYSKIIPIQLSNYAIDFANMNRGFLVCAGLPTDEEFASSIALGKLISEWEIEYFKEANFTSDLLYQITEFNESINYESTINLLINNIIQQYEDDDAEALQNDFNEKKEFYHNVLINLWKVTQDSGERPSFFPMRPLFNLIENITELKFGEVKKGRKRKICQMLTFLLNSFTHDKEKVNKIYNQEKDSKTSLLNDYIKSLGIDEYKQENKINSVTLYHSFIDGLLDRKALLIRTENYEAYRFFDLLTRNEDLDIGNTFIYNFVPFQFQDVGKDCQRKFDKLFEYLCKYKKRKANETLPNRIFCSIGNDPFSDYIIDILNSINHDKQCPTAILKGFPVYLPQFPDNIKFIFFINEGDIYNHELKNPVPYPLIDRLDHLFLNKKILCNYSEYLLNDSPYDQLKTKFLLDLPITPKEAKKKGNYLYSYTKSDFLYLKDALLEKDIKKGQEILNEHFQHSFVKSLDDLISRMKNAPSEFPFKTAIAFTKTPIYEQFVSSEVDYDDDEKKKEEEEEKEETKSSKDKKDKKYAIVKNIRIDPISAIEHAEKRKSMIIHSDIFNLPDENTLNNALFITHTLAERIIENNANEEEFLYIIVFHVNKNRIPEEFGFTTLFPVVWIESLPDTTQVITQEEEEQTKKKGKSKNAKPTKSSNKDEQPKGETKLVGDPLIQDICNAIYKEELPSDSPLLKRVYEKVTSEYGASLKDKDKQKNITNLKSSNGIKLQNSKGYKISNIIEAITSRAEELGETETDANANANDEGDNKNTKKGSSFKKIKEEITQKVIEIENNYNNKEIDEQTRIQKDHELNEQLNNLDIEVRFFSTVKNIVDIKVSMSLSIVIKYIASIKSNTTKIEDINNFARITYDSVYKFSKIIPDIELKTFSGKPSKEMNTNHPELLFYNVLKDFFNSDGYYNSLNKMKVYIKLLPPLNGMKLVEIFRYIKENYFELKGEIPFNDVPDATEVTIDMFDDFFNSRGLLYKDQKTQEICEFMKIYPDSATRNLYTMEIAVPNIKNDIDNDQWGNVQYKQILHSDISKSFISNCNANDYPHPCIIYSHFINVNGFTFQDYNGNDPDNKIYKNPTIPWIVNFFLYGMFNNCKHPGKDSNYLINFTDFLDLALKVDPNSATMLSTTKELPHFLYDLLFTEMCKNKPTEKVESFTYIDHLTDIPLLNDLVTNHPDFANIAKNDSLTKEVNKTDIEILADDYDPFSEENKNKITDKYVEIEEIENAIKTYNSWKESHLDELGDKNIFDNVRSHLFEESDKLDDMFVKWFLNPTVPLLARQIYEICKAVKDNNDGRMKAEFKILCRLINPWNDDDKVAKYFWKWFVELIPTKSPFNKDTKRLINTLSDSDLKPILMNCSPYYVHENSIISKKTDIRTFFIERLLYTNTILQIPSDKTDNSIICQIFNFMASLPFVKQTKNLYIIAGFINEVMRVYRDQINLLYLIFNTLQNCIDLLEIEQFKDLINDPNRTESRESLHEALKAADDYSKDGKAVDKLISYLKRLIEINNDTILISPITKQSPKTLDYRLVAKINVHTNLSLMNTFLPALAHMELKEGAELYRIIPNAFKILTNHKDAKNFVSTEKFFEALPSIFDFNDNNALRIFVKIKEIDEKKNDIFGLSIDDLPKSLCNELGNYLIQNNDKESKRKDIWKKVKEVKEGEESPDYSSILNTLIPLFDEESDNDDKKEKIDVNSLQGVKATAHFLKSNKIGDRSLFVKIDTNS